MDRLELDEARSALKEGGPAGLVIYMKRLDEAFGGRHFLLSSEGVDLVSGASRSSFLPQAPATRYRGYVHKVFHLARRSDDGLFWFAVVGSANEQGPVTCAYFLVCFLVTTGLLLFSLMYLVFPLRRISDAMSEFGRGELSRRVSSKRLDEVGQLSSSFNAMAEQIERSFRTERALLQDVSHELRAPLARLSLAVHLAKQEHGSDLLTQIESNVQRLSSLVGEITSFHQTWSTIVPSKRAISTTLSGRLSAKAQSRWATHSVELVVTTMSVVLNGARADLTERVLGNILRNAILHSPEGSRIQICLREEGQNAAVTVRDFGRGVAPENLERIFESFYREPRTVAAIPGLGLGLSIARRGAQWHGGTLKAENADPGLRLTATFPLSGVPLSLPLKNS